MNPNYDQAPPSPNVTTACGAQLQPILKQVFDRDTATLIAKDATYKGSWKKRGGRGAYFTLVRPWDRLVNMVQDGELDMFEIIQQEIDSGRFLEDGTLSASIADVRRYLALVESEMMLRKQFARGGSPPMPSPEKPVPRPLYGEPGFIPASTPPHEKCISP